MSEITQTQQLDSIQSNKYWQIFASAFLGLALLLFVVLAPMEVFHNATHEVRHSAGFPCH